jgi:hypothetical protein
MADGCDTHTRNCVRRSAQGGSLAKWSRAIRQVDRYFDGIVTREEIQQMNITCLRCAATITLPPGEDRQSVAELLDDFGWQATNEGANCPAHRLPLVREHT